MWFGLKLLLYFVKVKGPFAAMVAKINTCLGLEDNHGHALKITMPTIIWKQETKNHLLC